MKNENDMTFKFQCLKIKFYCNTVTFILFFFFLLLSVNSSFCTVMTELRNCGRNQMAVNPKILTIWPFKKIVAHLAKGSTLGPKVNENCCNQKWGSSCSHSETNKESRLVEKGKFALFLRLATWGEGRGVILSKGQLLHPHPQQLVGKSFYGWMEGPTCRNSQFWQSSLNWSYGGSWSALSWLF